MSSTLCGRQGGAGFGYLDRGLIHAPNAFSLDDAIHQILGSVSEFLQSIAKIRCRPYQGNNIFAREKLIVVAFR
jgi:hypothetical protein